jgi:hypothetical protein
MYTAAYIYRHMIPCLTQAGYRVIVPDFIGEQQRKIKIE